MSCHLLTCLHLGNLTPASPESNMDTVYIKTLRINIEYAAREQWQLTLQNGLENGIRPETTWLSRARLQTQCISQTLKPDFWPVRMLEASRTSCM